MWEAKDWLSTELCCLVSLFLRLLKKKENFQTHRDAFANFNLSAVLHILNVSHIASTFPPPLCCDAFNAFIQYMEFCISSVLKQVFNFSGISGCANDHLHVKNERTHNSAATHKYRKVRNWRLQYAI